MFRTAAFIAICLSASLVPSNREELTVGDPRESTKGVAILAPQPIEFPIIIPQMVGNILEETRAFPVRPPVAAGHSFSRPIEVLPKRMDSRERKVSNQTKEEDRRVKAIDLFFEECDCPLVGFGEVFVVEADKNGIPYALLPAIGFIESSGGKSLFRTNNPFGWGKNNFSSFGEAITEVSAHLGGKIPETAKYYGRRDLRLKLENYNPEPGYPDLVLGVLDEIMDIERKLK